MSLPAFPVRPLATLFAPVSESAAEPPRTFSTSEAMLSAAGPVPVGRVDVRAAVVGGRVARGDRDDHGPGAVARGVDSASAVHRVVVVAADEHVVVASPFSVSVPSPPFSRSAPSLPLAVSLPLPQRTQSSPASPLAVSSSGIAHLRMTSFSVPPEESVVAVVAVHDVFAAPATEDVVPRTADQAVAAVVSVHGVVPGTAVQVVRFGAAVEGVITLSAAEGVRSGGAVDGVITDAADKDIRPGAPGQRVVALPALDLFDGRGDVVGGGAGAAGRVDVRRAVVGNVVNRDRDLDRSAIEDPVEAVAAVQRVVVAAAIEGVVVIVAVEHVGTGSADELVIAGAAVQLVVAADPLEDVVSPEATDDIVAGGSLENVGAGGAGDRAGRSHGASGHCCRCDDHRHDGKARPLCDTIHLNCPSPKPTSTSPIAADSNAVRVPVTTGGERRSSSVRPSQVIAERRADQRQIGDRDYGAGRGRPESSGRRPTVSGDSGIRRNSPLAASISSASDPRARCRESSTVAGDRLSARLAHFRRDVAQMGEQLGHPTGELGALDEQTRPHRTRP